MNKLQLCLMLDCTESMSEWIELSKNKLLDILHSVKKDNPTLDIEVAFLAYRDVCDGDSRIHVYDFTTDHNFIVEKIKQSVAKGGGDEAEDVAIAYSTANRLNWNGDVRIIVHIADAPAHGIGFHTVDVSDDLPNGTTGISLKREIRNICLKNIKIIFGEINKTTVMMTNQFEKIYRDNYASHLFSMLYLKPDWSYFAHPIDQENYFHTILSDSISQEVTRSTYGVNDEETRTL
jgi:hypothetical protein